MDTTAPVTGDDAELWARRASKVVTVNIIIVIIIVINIVISIVIIIIAITNFGLEPDVQKKLSPSTSSFLC